MKTLNALLLLLVAVVTSTASCGPKRVMVDGKEMTEEEAAEYTYQQGKQAKESGDVPTAKARLKEVVDRFAEAEKSADALAELGAIAMEEGGCAAAVPYYQQLKEKHGSSARAVEAERALERCKGTSAATEATALAGLEDKFVQAGSDAERKEVASKAADTAQEAGEFAAAVRWLLKVRGLEGDDAQKRAVEQEIVDLIDRRVSFQDVRALLEATSGNDFPKEALTYKLARIQYHVRDLANARTTLQSFLETWPKSAWAEGAKDLLGLIEARSKVNPLNVGILVPLTGKLKAYGENAIQAIKLAHPDDEKKKDPNAINFLIRDSKGDAAEAARAVQDFVVVDGCVAIIGAVFRVEAEAAAYKAQELGVPMISLSSAEDITEVGPYVFRNGLPNQAQAEALVDYAMNTMGMKSFGILYPKHPYGETMLHLFWDAVDARKGEVRAIESYGANDTTFTDPVKRLVGRDILDLRSDYHQAIRECAKQPDTYRRARCEGDVRTSLKPIIDFDGLFIPDYPRTLALLAPALAFEDIIVETEPRYLKKIEKTLGRKVKPVTLLGVDGWADPNLPEKAGRYVENAIFPAGFYPEAGEKRASEFVNEFRKKYNNTPRLPEALFYDAVKIVKDVAAKQKPQNREEMRVALRTVHDFAGVTGKTSFKDGPDAKKNILMLTIKNGVIQEAPPRAEGPPPAREEEPEDAEPTKAKASGN